MINLSLALISKMGCLLYLRPQRDWGWGIHRELDGLGFFTVCLSSCYGNKVSSPAKLKPLNLIEAQWRRGGSDQVAGMVPLGRGVIMADEEVSGRVVRDLAHELGGG